LWAEYDGSGESVNRPVLTVAIPTYNRAEYLAELLSVLQKQLTSDTEVVVSDNFSTDSTEQVTNSFKGRIRVSRNARNIGADANLVSCLEQAKGQFVWLMGDDDIPCGNAVSLLLEGIAGNVEARAFVLTTKWTSDKAVLRAAAAERDATWERWDRDSCLRRLGIFITTMSGIVVRRDEINWEFVRRQVGTNLIPAALLLSAVGEAGFGILSSEALITCRSNSSWGYAVLKTFTTNLSRLLGESAAFGYSASCRAEVLKQSLRTVVFPFLRRKETTAREMGAAIWYLALRSELYSEGARAVVRWASRVLKKAVLCWHG
jgi:abequosyltransferase